jgi:hypothetical protein
LHGPQMATECNMPRPLGCTTSILIRRSWVLALHSPKPVLSSPGRIDGTSFFFLGGCTVSKR